MKATPPDDLAQWVQNYWDVVVVDREDLMPAEWEMVRQYFQRLLANKSVEELPHSLVVQLRELYASLEGAHDPQEEREILRLLLDAFPSVNNAQKA